MYLLDTDTLTHLHGGNSNVVERLKSIVDAEVAITIITKVEILRRRLDYLSTLRTSSNIDYRTIVRVREASACAEAFPFA